MDSPSVKESLEQGKLVSKSGLLDKAWSKILAHGIPESGLKFETYEERIYTIVVFAAPSDGLNSSSTHLCVPNEKNRLHFLRSENISSFSLLRPAYQHFLLAIPNRLDDLKAKLLDLLEPKKQVPGEQVSKKQVIITGAALGGSVASLFTLWLLEKVEPKFKRPLCITFGSPLVGDASLQQILENTLSNSCFLHVADAAQTPIQAGFKPFGTFLICVGSRCICTDDPETVTELLGGANTGVVVWRDYGEVLDRLTQQEAADSRRMMDENVINRMAVMAGRAASKKPRFDPLIKLNDMKINMIYLEWYKKQSRKKNIGYYDQFKTETIFPYEARRRELNDYWKELVGEVEKMPQSEKAVLKTRSLLAGNNYKRMVEPLDIAEYYRDGGREYRSSRPRHYVMLEKWFKAEVKEQDRSEGKDLSDLLTFDSCFWAEVEEAIVVTNALKTHGVGGRDVLFEKLVRFEEYVWGMLEKREVSPEIFLKESSFMKWWREYKEIKGSSSDFTEFMSSRGYQTYGQAS